MVKTIEIIFDNIMKVTNSKRIHKHPALPDLTQANHNSSNLNKNLFFDKKFEEESDESFG